VAAGDRSQVDFSVHSEIGRQGGLHLARNRLDCADEAGGVAGGEQLLGVGAAAVGAGGRQLDVQASVVGTGGAVAAAGGVDFGGVQHFIELGHGGSFRVEDFVRSGLKNVEGSADQALPQLADLTG